MLLRRSIKLVVALTLFLSGLARVAQASSFSAVVVYGDSLSDNGNLFAASGQPGAPYFQGRRSDGAVAVEQLAVALGAPLLDFAWIGATTGIGNFADGGTPTSAGAFSLPGMQTEFLATQPLLAPYLASALFVVWGGANDFLSPSPLDLTPAAIISRAVSDEVGIVNGLVGLGAQHVLVPGIPDLGLTPYFQSLGPLAAGQATAASAAYNATLLASLPAGVLFSDTFGLEHGLIANPGAFGFTNVTDPCFDGLTVCANPSQYLFFDSFHPTTATDGFAAQAFLSDVTPAAPVPEPSTFVLVLGGVLLLTRAAGRSQRNIPTEHVVLSVPPDSATIPGAKAKRRPEARILPPPI
jgi:cholinesterase